ncbi:MAG: ATP-binding protein [Candidatus Micrarchaeota archaeon]|nr:ATP-binding protein [Candidatus Micrarchaeota archaeon]
MTKNDLRAYTITSLPETLDLPAMVSSVLGAQFMLMHDFSSHRTSLLCDDPELVERISKAIPGFEATPSSCPNISRLKAFILFPPADALEILSDIYRIIGKKEARLYVSFAKPDFHGALVFKRRVEDLLSRRETRITKMNGGKFAPSHSIQSDLYYNSDERATLLSLLNELNLITATNGSGYRVVLIADEEGDSLERYLSAKGLVLESMALNCRNAESLYSKMREMEAAPLSHQSAAKYLCFSERIERRKIVKTWQAESAKGEIELGRVLEDGVIETKLPIRIRKSSLNLGTILTGLPGTGKSVAAMSLFSDLNGEEGSRTSIAVIAPTKEWGQFAARNGLNLIRFYYSNVPINFFRCGSAATREKFYENLAMLLAHASNAGPYQNSLEKCLLTAFRTVYSSQLCPDPTEVYMQIEEAIIERHAKRTNTAVKYTKHGENIRAALENLRQMLFRPEFAATDGIDIEEMLRQGVVFDLSNVGNNMKQFFYALILNRIYSFADGLDEMGNESLRLAIILEEAQVALSQNELSAINLDLKQRIQDFRKKGVGLCLITHSVTDIPASVRRLCQTKLYFRQSSDIARYAAQDLGLEVEEQDGIGKLRSLEQGSFAALYLESKGNERIPRGPIFAKAQMGSQRAGDRVMPLTLSKIEMETDCQVAIKEAGEPLRNAKVELSYLGMVIARGATDEGGMITFKSLIRGKSYLLAAIGEKKRNGRSVQIRASEKVELNFQPAFEVKGKV